MDDAKNYFKQKMIQHMQGEFGIGKARAEELTNKYIEEIKTEEIVTQQLGPDYFVAQILMAEGVIPYRPT